MGTEIMNSIFPYGGQQDWLLVTISQSQQSWMATWLTIESQSPAPKQEDN